jgi:hypothetical protein
MSDLKLDLAHSALDTPDRAADTTLTAEKRCVNETGIVLPVGPR